VHQCALNPFLVSSVLFTDEAAFTRNGIITFHNNHVWAEENPRAVVQSRHQQQFSINVWAGIIGDVLVGPHVLPQRLTGNSYQNFLENDLLTLLEDLPLAIRACMWFMHDGAPPHFSITVRELLEMYPARRTGRGGPTAWPPRSPDSTPVNDIATL
jgi:hypothetical protein